MQQRINREEISEWAKKDRLEGTLLAGIHGAPELKRDEKAYHLGEFRERVIKLLSKEQAAEPIIYPEIVEALQDEKAAKMIISASIGKRNAEKYRELAASLNKSCTVINDPQFKGEAGLIVAGEGAVDKDDIMVEARKVRLGRLGLPEKLIGAAGKKICRECRQRIIHADPREAGNYRSLSWADHLLGARCPAHEGDE